MSKNVDMTAIMRALDLRERGESPESFLVFFLTF